MIKDSTKRIHREEPRPRVGRAQILSLDDTGTFLRLVERLEEAPAFSSPAKRALDVILSSLLLVLLAPVLGLTMLLVRLTSPGPAIFVQQRIGFQGRQFSMYKLRTMREGAEREEDRLAEDQDGRTFLKIENDHRVTPIGRALRKSSLDELPQLVNVLKGDMSLVGPRPLLLCDFRKFPRREQLRRFSVKPGITGLWQVSGRSALPDSERMRLDIEYVDRWSLGLDLLILARTLPVVLSARGAT
jgi:lipopolysaccharide/colanic/teichoic acid biosynthesis glycosyltransferase